MSRNTNAYAFDISLTDNCNFRCSYCVERNYQNPLYMGPEKSKGSVIFYRPFLTPSISVINWISRN